MQTLKSENNWTGGQYSIFRMIVGLYLLVHFVQLIPWGTEMFSNNGVLPDSGASPFIFLFPNMLGVWDSPIVVTALLSFGSLLSIFFAIGYYDRVAALCLWYIWACLFGRNPLIANPSIPYVGWLFLAHAFLPKSPYGSLEAKDRLDPGGGWKMPQEIYAVAWMVMAISYTYSGYTKLISPSWVNGTAFYEVLNNPLARPGIVRDLLLELPSVFLKVATWSALSAELLFLPLVFFRKLRPWIWLVLVGMHLGLLTIVSFADLSLGMLMMHFFTFNPGWIPGLKQNAKDKIFYDGNCGLCHGAVRFVLAEDGSERFLFAALQSEAFAKAVSENNRSKLPDSIVIVCEDGKLLMRSEAILYIMKRLGGLWRLIAAVFALIPRLLRDFVYDKVAEIRYRLFPKPPDLCPLMPVNLRSRFFS